MRCNTSTSGSIALFKSVCAALQLGWIGNQDLIPLWRFSINILNVAALGALSLFTMTLGVSYIIFDFLYANARMKTQNATDACMHATP